MARMARNARKPDLIEHILASKERRESMTTEEIDFESEKIQHYASTETKNNVALDVVVYLSEFYDMSLFELDEIIQKHYPERTL